MKQLFSRQIWISTVFILLAYPGLINRAVAQDYVTGAFDGRVTDSVTGVPIEGATVQIVNDETGVPSASRTNANGRFFKNLLQPADYTITVSKQGYKTDVRHQSLQVMKGTQVVPVPVQLVPEVAVATPTASPSGTPEPSGTPAPQTSPSPSTSGTTPPATTPPSTTPRQQVGIEADINRTDGQRGGAYSQKEVSSLPLGAFNLTRTFDELGLLIPGVALPPATLGSVAGPGVGAGVGSAGQFSVNGLRSRANNFTVDGSDNNDEDIGVRRQGFLALVPQPIESIREFQMITLLAPAQYGRNIGAQVNAISRSGGNATHGTLYGFFNSSQLNARNTFDSANGNATVPLRSGSQNVLNSSGIRCCDENGFPLLDSAGRVIPINPSQITVTNQSNGKDSFTLGQGGLVLGGPLVPERSSRPGRSLFYFISAEGHILNATQEQSFAVPTVAQRGLFNSGATGINATPFTDINGSFAVGSPNFFYPSTTAGDQLFSFFPFPNNPNGVYGANTLTQTLPASGQSKILSGKVDGNFKIHDKQQSLTARYNFTQDWREIPATGGAIFSTLRPRVRTQNFSTFLNSDLSGANSTKAVFNQLRLSYGRTRLNFEDVPDRTGFLLPSMFGNPNDPEAMAISQFLGVPITFNNANDARFLLRARVLENFTLPDYRRFFSTPRVIPPNTGPVVYRAQNFTTENLGSSFGPVGQVIIGGFSPVGVDVFNFPQKRVNNTYQLADTVTVRKGDHSFAFGADIRRTELNSELPRNARPLITVYGAPQLTGTPITVGPAGDVTVTGFTNLRLTNRFINAVDLAAAGVTSGFFQTLSTKGSSHINLRYYQFNFFGQDEWRIRRNLSLSYGLRYEYNTPPRELNNKIESTFNDPLLSSAPDLVHFIDGRTKIFDKDLNNFGPRVSFAYSPRPDAEKTTVVRAGYGLFFDQIPGAVVSQSRNVFPNFLTANFAGGGFNGTTFGNSVFGILSEPFCPCILRNLNELGTIGFLAGSTAQTAIPRIGATTGRGSASFGATLPARHLPMPMAHQYGVTVEQELSGGLVLSGAYVGTLGRNLLRFTTPNLGPNELILPLAVDALDFSPTIYGYALSPGVRVGAGGSIPNPNSTFANTRPFNRAGVINIFETTAKSRYDSLQLQLRGRYRLLGGATQFQVNYVFGKAKDDVSDVFDLAGAPALPQNSLSFAGEYTDANFDARHRIASNFITDLSSWGKRNAFLHAIFSGTEVATQGVFQTGQPFTVGTINDVNLDGNLTDRINSTNGIVLTDDRRQPLQLTVNPATLLAPVGQDGAVPRNAFRSSNLWVTNAAVIKTITLSEQTKLIFRAEAFNLFNRANYGIPVRFIEFPGFGGATNTVTPARRIQFALKLAF